MARLTWTAETAAGDVTVNGPDISDANMDRALDYFWTVHPQWIDPDDHSLGLKPKNNTNLAQAYRDWANGQWRGLVNAVRRHEDIIDAQAAKEANTDIA